MSRPALRRPSSLHRFLSLHHNHSNVTTVCCCSCVNLNTFSIISIGEHALDNSERTSSKHNSLHTSLTSLHLITPPKGLQCQSKPLLSETRQTKHWSKPESGWLKINTDGSFSEQTRAGAWGYVIRDDRGSVKKAGAGAVSALQSAFHAELLGCLEGLRMAVQLGLNQIVLETDAQLVKSAIEGDEYRLSSVGGLITEIKHIIAYDLSSISIRFCPRACNKLAHELASLGCNLPGDGKISWDTVPHSLEDVVSSDLAVTDE